ncbi:hypothetical protein U1Q18_035632 [Sarracenia purpurea var. burkii]
MAEGASNNLFLCLLFVLPICSIGTVVGFSYDSMKHNPILSAAEKISFMKLDKVCPSHIRVSVADQQTLKFLSKTRAPVDLYLNKTILKNLRNHKPSTISRLKTLLKTSLSQFNIKSMVVSLSRRDLPGENDIHILLSALKSICSVLGSFHLENQPKAPASFPPKFLENLNKQQKRDLLRVLNFIKRIGSFVIVEVTIKSVTRRAIPCRAVSVVLKIKGSSIPGAMEALEFTDKMLRSLKKMTRGTWEITGLFAELSPPKQFELKKEEMFRSFHRELLDTIVTVPSTNPASTPVMVPSTVPSVNPANLPAPITTPVTTPGTVPGTQPVTNPVTTYPAPLTPVTNPVAPPATTGNPAPSTGVPGTTPVTNPVAPPATTGNPIPSTGVPASTPVTNPVAPPATTGAPPTTPVTNPVAPPATTGNPSPSTGAPPTTPVTNPAAPPATTGNPPPSTGAPATTPVTNPVAPPATTSSAQSWCVAKGGATENALQAALDYACGIGGADCSAIQQGARCFNPNTLEKHASYAFNSYYQKNPVQTSCDFGGTAMVTSTNPSTGTCIYLLSSSSSSSSSPLTVTTPTPATPAAGGTVTGSGGGTPPTVLNTSSPSPGSTTVYGGSSPSFNSSTSMAIGYRPFTGSCCIILVTSLITASLPF